MHVVAHREDYDYSTYVQHSRLCIPDVQCVMPGVQPSLVSMNIASYLKAQRCVVGDVLLLWLMKTPCLLTCSFGHPYDYEIQVFQPTEAQLKEVEPIKPLPLEDTPFVLVETVEQLQDMVKQLKTVSEFAVDLEVCLALHV